MSSQERPNFTLTALFIGVPVLVGASCYYLYATRNKGDPSKKAGQKGEAEPKILSPFDQVMHLKKTGNQHYSRKNYEVAIEHYTRAIELSQALEPPIKPEDLAIFYQNRAACNETLNKLEQVIADCDEAIKLKKTYTKAYLRRAKAYEKLENYERALVNYFSTNLLDKFQNQTNLEFTENLVKLVSKVKAAEAMKEHKPTWPSNQTIKAYFSALSQDPIRDKISDQEIRTSEQLQPVFDEASKPENDSDPLSLLIRGTCQSLMGDLKSARELFDKLLTLDDNECSPRIKANALIKKSGIVISDPLSTMTSIEKDLETVHELLDRAAELDPENPDIYLHKAQALTLSEKLDDALQALEKAIELKEDLHAATAQKFYIRFKLADASNLQELIQSFKAVVDANPEAFDLQQMYAQVMTEMNFFDQADQVLLKLSKKDPTDGSTVISRACLQFQLRRDPDEVVKLLNEALAIDPKIIFAYEILGSIETQRGRLDKSMEVFETALRYAQSEAEYARLYGLFESAKYQKIAADELGVAGVQM